MPPGWVSRDVGSPAIAGTTSHEWGTWTVTGAGANIWGTSDQFQFAFQTITGDVEITARVAAFETANDWSKAGVMIRDGLARNATNAAMVVSRAVRPAFQRRTTVGGTTVRTVNGPLGGVAMWVRLVRKGNLFTAYRSDNGSSWTTVGSATITMSQTVSVGLAVTSRDAGALATARFADVTVSTGPAGLPAPWATADIGNPSLAGSATAASASSFTVSGAGIDIWSEADQFRYVYQPANSDVEIVAHVTSLVHVDPWSKAGVMIRESLNADSPHAMMIASGSEGWSFQYREFAGGGSLDQHGTPESAPGWVRLVRTGDQFSAYQSLDGSTWTLVGTNTISMAGAVYVGLAVTSHSSEARATATFDNVSVYAGTAAPKNEPPVVELTRPANGSNFTAPANILLEATASDADGSVASVDFYQGSTLLGSDTTSPYSFTWTGAGAGSYQLTVIARDDAGAMTTSGAVDVTVGSGTNTPPTVSITSPSPGASFTAPATITIEASASDPGGSVVRVEFFRGTTMIGSDSTSPYSATWSGATAGNYVLTARAVDNAGAMRTSAGVNISVTSTPNQLPSVSITSPAPGQAFTPPASITIAATASDPDGTIVGVDFFVDSQLIATDTTSPYGASWANIDVGTYWLTAVARDNAGGTSTSVGVTVVVEGTPTPTTVVFEASPDHDTEVTSYVVALYRADDPVTASPVATRDIGKPTPVDGEISVDISTLVNPLPAGSYYAVVRASGPGGTSASAPSPPFTK